MEAMPKLRNDNNEKIKRYLVIGLACVALLVAYFRFFRSHAEPTVVIDQVPKNVTIYPIRPGENMRRGTHSNFARDVRSIAVGNIRDIFERPRIPVESQLPTPAAGRSVNAPKATAPQDIYLELKGTITGGDSPMAIINDKFVRLGEEIETFRVVRISSNEVVLRAGEHQRIIQVIKPEKHLEPSPFLHGK